MSVARIIRDSGSDISTFSGISGEQVNQVMGNSAGHQEYLRQYEAAEDKCKFNAEWFAAEPSRG